MQREIRVFSCVDGASKSEVFFTKTFVMTRPPVPPIVGSSILPGYLSSTWEEEGIKKGIVIDAWELDGTQIVCWGFPVSEEVLRQCLLSQGWKAGRNTS